jgi:hypothetical protein
MGVNSLTCPLRYDNPRLKIDHEITCDIDRIDEAVNRGPVSAG